MALLVRLIPIIAIIVLTILLNMDLDKLDARKDEITKNWFGKVVWFLIGWTYSLRGFGTVIRYAVSFTIFWLVINKIVDLMLR